MPQASFPTTPAGWAVAVFVSACGFLASMVVLYALNRMGLA